MKGLQDLWSVNAEIGSRLSLIRTWVNWSIFFSGLRYEQRTKSREIICMATASRNALWKPFFALFLQLRKGGENWHVPLNSKAAKSRLPDLRITKVFLLLPNPLCLQPHYACKRGNQSWSEVDASKNKAMAFSTVGYRNIEWIFPPLFFDSDLIGNDRQGINQRDFGKIMRSRSVPPRQVGPWIQTKDPSASAPAPYSTI